MKLVDALNELQRRAVPDEAPRVLISIDACGFHVRHVRTVIHDLELDEKTYQCDSPVGSCRDPRDLGHVLAGLLEDEEETE